MTNHRNATNLEKELVFALIETRAALKNVMFQTQGKGFVFSNDTINNSSYAKMLCDKALKKAREDIKIYQPEDIELMQALSKEAA